MGYSGLDHVNLKQKVNCSTIHMRFVMTDTTVVDTDVELYESTEHGNTHSDTNLPITLSLVF